MMVDRLAYVSNHAQGKTTPDKLTERRKNRNEKSYDMIRVDDKKQTRLLEAHGKEAPQHHTV